MGTKFSLPRRLTDGNNIEPQADFWIRENHGVYVTLTRADNGQKVELPEEGPGDEESTIRIIEYARANRRRYVEERIAEALADDWERERLGLIEPEEG